MARLAALVTSGADFNDSSENAPEVVESLLILSIVVHTSVKDLLGRFPQQSDTGRRKLVYPGGYNAVECAEGYKIHVGYDEQRGKAMAGALNHTGVYCQLHVAAGCTLYASVNQ